jgi:hypothetical protein
MFILEAGLALSLLLLIVWWTLGPVRKRELDGAEHQSDGAVEPSETSKAD